MRVYYQETSSCWHVRSSCETLAKTAIFHRDVTTFGPDRAIASPVWSQGAGLARRLLPCKVCAS